MWPAGQSHPEEADRSLGAMGGEGVLHRQMSHVHIRHTAGQTGAEQSHNACYRTQSLPPAALIWVLQTEVDYCL
jgi:hypothetical protein